MMSYAAVPLYKLFCQVTGYGGNPSVSENNMVKGDFGEINVRFDSSTEKDSPVFFKPVKNKN